MHVVFLPPTSIMNALTQKLTNPGCISVEFLLVSCMNAVEGERIVGALAEAEVRHGKGPLH